MALKPVLMSKEIKFFVRWNYGNKHFYYKIDLSDMETLPEKLKLINET